MLDFYREPYVINSRKLTKRSLATTFVKTFLLMLYPLPAVYIACTAWYLIFHQNHFHFHKEVKEYVVAGFIPAFMIVYSMLTAVFLTRVIEEYKAVRMAVKRYDLHAFMDLRDEDVSPLAHALMTILALFLIGAFMGLEYPNASSGVLIVGVTTYIFSFIFWVIREIDDPFEGIWFIRNIHPEWMELDCKEWREEHYVRIRKGKLTNDGPGVVANDTSSKE
jgi:fucose permease